MRWWQHHIMMHSMMCRRRPPGDMRRLQWPQKESIWTSPFIGHVDWGVRRVATLMHQNQRIGHRACQWLLRHRHGCKMFPHWLGTSVQGTWVAGWVAGCARCTGCGLALRALSFANWPECDCTLNSIEFGECQIPLCISENRASFLCDQEQPIKVAPF